MRTVYEVQRADGSLVPDRWHSMAHAAHTARERDRYYPQHAPHTVVERQVAGPEDTDELLRLRALVDDLMRAVVNLEDEYLISVCARHGFGGES